MYWPIMRHKEIRDKLYKLGKLYQLLSMLGTKYRVQLDNIKYNLK